MALDTDMNDMDIDMTLEEEDPDIARMQAQAAEMSAVWIHHKEEKAAVTNVYHKAL